MLPVPLGEALLQQDGAQNGHHDVLGVGAGSQPTKARQKTWASWLLRLNKHRANFLRYFAVSMLAWVSFDFALGLVMRVPANPDNTPLVLHVSSQVIVPIMGITFAVFTERAATELKHRIENIETHLNREAAVLTMLLPKLGLLLNVCPEHRDEAFIYLEEHIDRLRDRLHHGEVWGRSYVNVFSADPADRLLMAVHSVEEVFYAYGNDVPPAQQSLLRGVIELVREFVVLRAQRTVMEQTSLPSFHWASLICFGATFALGFLWAACSSSQALAASSLPTDSPPQLLSPPPSPPLACLPRPPRQRTFDHRLPAGPATAPPAVASRPGSTRPSASRRTASRTRQLLLETLCYNSQELPITTRPCDVEAVGRAIRCKRLKVMWVLLVLSQFLVLEMSLDMQNPYAGQYKVDDHGLLAAVFDGPLKAKLKNAWAESLVPPLPPRPPLKSSAWREPLCQDPEPNPETDQQQ